MNSVYMVMSCSVENINYENVIRVFTDRADAKKYAAYLKRTDDSFGQYKYYVVERALYDHFDE